MPRIPEKKFGGIMPLFLKVLRKNLGYCKNKTNIFISQKGGEIFCTLQM
jgi:hypothetical protein